MVREAYYQFPAMKNWPLCDHPPDRDIRTSVVAAADAVVAADQHLQ